MSSRVLTSVYCGHEYPQDTPTHGNHVLTEHIKVCASHPLRKAEANIAMGAALINEGSNGRRLALHDMGVSSAGAPVRKGMGVHHKDADKV